MAKKLGERLIESGLATPEQIEQALQQQKITGRKLGDCLVEIGLLQEQALLRFLAAEFNTRFVSAEKLAKAKIPTEVLDKVPVRVAEAQNVLPLAYDAERSLLSIIAAEPQNKSVMDELKLLANVDEIYAYVGLRSAIAAGIKKYYYGDSGAFNAPSGPSAQTLRSDVATMANVYESSRTEVRGLGTGLDTDARLRLRGGTGTNIRSQHGQLREALGIRGGSFTDADYAETLNVLLGLVESGRKELRGHSAQLARQAQLVAAKLHLTPREVAHVAIAAQLHDVGKRHDRHCTLTANAAREEWKNDARKYLRAPLKLFESVSLPSDVTRILTHLYEAFDGTGVPHGTKGEEIPIGARIIAAVDAFLDLAKNPANALGRAHSKDEAFEQLRSAAGDLYDPVVVDLIGRIYTGEILEERIANEGRQLLIAEPDEGTRSDLADAANKVGVSCRAVATLDAAVDTIFGGEADVLLLGFKLGAAEVQTLMQYMRSQPETAATPILIIGEPPEQTGIERLKQMGATEVLSASIDIDKMADLIRQHYQHRVDHGAPGRLIRGSFDEIPQAELLKALGEGRKNGRLTLRAEGKEGFIHFEKGKAVYAIFGADTGERAMQALLKFSNADFTYDPEALLTELPQFEAPLERGAA